MKHTYTILLTIALFLSAYAGIAQQHVCGTDQQYKETEALHPEIAVQRSQFNRAFAEAMKSYNVNDYKKANGLGKTSAPKYIIPVVVHIFHQNGPENISDAQVLSEIDQMNKSFRKQNSDTDNVRAIFKDIAADAQIEFRLAKKDPKGNCTNGIVRYYTPNTQKGNDALKKLSVWDTKRYYNIWVVNTINRGPGLSLAGYAQFPFSTSTTINSASTDGIMVIHREFGNIGTADQSLKPIDKRTTNQTTASHETGHWLGLFHPFQGDSCDNEGDGIQETPTTYFAPTPGEPLRNRCDIPNFNSCSTDNPDLPDQYENFMDYFIGPCASNMFVLQQAARMHFCLENYRRELWQQENLERTGVVPSYNCSTKPVASFNMSSPGKTVCMGSNVTFRDNSYNAEVTAWSWDFGDGASPATASTSIATVSYSTPGWKTVKLTATGANGTDEAVMENYIYVQAPTEFYGTGDGFYNADWDYSNDFLQQGWYFDNEAAGTWTRTDKAQVNGNMSLMLPAKNLVYGFTYSLVSPTYNFTGSSNPYISYSYSFASNFISASSTFDSRDRLQLFVSYDCGKNWLQRKITRGSDSVEIPNPLTTAAAAQSSQDYVPVNQTQWRSDGISGAAVGSNANLSSIKFKLAFTFLGGNNFYLDALMVGVNSGLSDFSAKEVNFNVTPNPFNASAVISYELTNKQTVSIRLYDIVGKEVADLQTQTRQAGKHETVISRDALGLKNGLYFIKTTIGGSSFSTKVLIN